MIVVGTAGHIDHGKSSIVRRLTGTDPDRLPEEKARGMTIDLGFAFYRTGDGEEVAFVDVPGHERFVRNMIAGAGGIDAVMLVIAADDGWMPQSEEHFAILKLLRIRSGIIVINKSELVESDWLDLLEQDIRGRVKDSFLVSAPIFRISAETGAGFDALRDGLDALARSLHTRKDIGKARLYIDRSFVQQGIGGVVTGTLRGGSLSVGQPVSVWPAMQNCKVRTLQSHGVEVEQVLPGHRTAVSLTGIDRELLIRGGVISDHTDLSFFSEHPILALSAELLRSASIPLDDRRRVLLMVGTTEVEGEVRLFESDAIAPGDSGVLFFKPERPIYCLVGDRFIIRLPTPAVTLGGGMVLDHLERFPRRRDLADLEYLKVRQSGKVSDTVVSEFSKRPFTESNNFLVNSDFSADEIQSAVNDLISHKLAGRYGGCVYGTRILDDSVSKLKDRLTAALLDKSHVKGLAHEELVALSPFERESSLVLVEYLVAQGMLVKLGDKYNLAGRGMSLKGPVKDAHDKILAQLQAERYSSPALGILAANGKPFHEAIKYILDSGEGHKCGSEFILLHDVWAEVVGYIREKINHSGALTVADLKDRFGFTRKYAIPILEETDRIKLTRREGDIRVKGDRFEDEEFIS